MYKNRQTGYLYVAPCLLVLLLVLGFPLCYVIGLSFYKINPMVSQKFVGISNYLYVLKDPVFWKSLGNTFNFTFWSVLFHLICGMLVALLLNRTFRGRTLARILLLLPWMLAYVVGGITWRWCLNGMYGIFNEILVRMGFLSQYIAWLGNPATAMPAVVIANIWKQYPYVMLMLLAGLQGVSREQYESAAIDGAGPWRTFWSITIPNMRKIIMITTTLDFIWTFKQFDLIYVMTGGGPGDATEVLSTLIYKSFFNAFDFGYASSSAVLLLVIVLILSSIYIWLVSPRRKANEE